MNQLSIVTVSRPEKGTLLLGLEGSWKIDNELPSIEALEEEINTSPGLRRIAFDVKNLAEWDSGLLIFLIKVSKHCLNYGVHMDLAGLPEGARRLVGLSLEASEREAIVQDSYSKPFLARIGDETLTLFQSGKDMVTFIGEAFLAFLKLLTGKAHFRWSDLILTIQECGAQAFPIVSLISVLVGLILAFVGAVQLKLFGAQIYIADLVGIAMAREMGAIMTAIIMAGRTGAAFAAQLGTMTVNEEMDALTTMGISPVEFLVLPRMVALALMIPLLCLYSDFMGILGGAIVGTGMLDLSFFQYYEQTRNALNLTHFSIGIFKSAVFGVLVALAGCLRGMQCGRSASAVGDAATSAVVTGIVLIVISDAIFAVLTELLGI